MAQTKETALVGVKRELTVPAEISQAVGLEPGDRVQFRAIGPKTLEVTVLPRMTFEEWLERFRIDEPVDVEQLIREGEEAAADELIRKIENGCE